jgi:hypothetical protein
MQWFQDPDQSNVDKLNNVRGEARRHCRTKKKEYLQVTFAELETNSKIKKKSKICRGINDFNNVYQHRTNIVRVGKGDLVTDSHSILAR